MLYVGGAGGAEILNTVVKFNKLQLNMNFVCFELQYRVEFNTNVRKVLAHDDKSLRLGKSRFFVYSS